jgi:hypothetical protein
MTVLMVVSWLQGCWPEEACEEEDDGGRRCQKKRGMNFVVACCRTNQKEGMVMMAGD